jgi:hypothetical protein
MRRAPCRATRLVISLGLAVCGALCAARAHAELGAGSALALPLLASGEKPELILAQRTIDRAWGPSEDSTYVEVAVPGWRSEGIAFAMSAAIPGAGHAYVHESSGLFFAVVEVAAWTLRRHWQGRADRLHSWALGFVGDPRDSNATWSFRRWERVTDKDAADLRALYAADPETFFAWIARDPQYLAGWSTNAIPPRDEFRNALDRGEGMLARKRYATTAIWINHLLAGLDALRAARIANLPLGRDLELKLGAGWRGESPTLLAAVGRRF